MQFFGVLSLFLVCVFSVQQASAAAAATTADTKEVLMAKLAVAEAKIALGDAKVERAEANLEQANIHLQMVQLGQEVPVQPATMMLKMAAVPNLSRRAPPRTRVSSGDDSGFPQQYTLSVSGICGNYTLHGLWPSQDAPVLSDQDLDTSSFPDDLLNLMNTYWPDCTGKHGPSNQWFWNHEWTNHGNRYPSANLTPQAFFQAVMDFYVPQVTSGFIQQNCDGNFKFNGPDCRLCYTQESQGGPITFSSAGSC